MVIVCGRHCRTPALRVSDSYLEGLYNLVHKCRDVRVAGDVPVERKQSLLLTARLVCWCREAGTVHPAHEQLATVEKVASVRQRHLTHLHNTPVDLYCVSKNRARNIIPHNSRKCGPILILLSLSHSPMSCQEKME